MLVLDIGMKFYGHDSAIFVVNNHDKDVFGMSTERITRYKHDDLFAIEIIEKFLEYKNIDCKEVKIVNVSIPFIGHESHVISINKYIYTKSLRKFLEATYIKDFFNKHKLFKEKNIFGKIFDIFTKSGGFSFLYEYLKSKSASATLNYVMKNHLYDIFPNADINIKYYDHEFCHVASAYYMSPFDKALVFSMDGFGDDLTYSRVYIGDGYQLKEVGSSKSKKEFLNLGNNELSETATLCSIGGIYSYITKMLDFQEGSDEGKTEALAAYGSYANPFYEELHTCLKINNGQIIIDIDQTEKILNFSRVKKLLEIMKKEDIAAATQKFSEDVVVAYVKYYVDKYKINNICLSGGVHANVIINLNIFENISSNIYIIPAMADDGTAQGAVLANLVENGHEISWIKEKQVPYYGTSYNKLEVKSSLDKYKDTITYKDLGDNWTTDVAQFVVDGKIGSIFHGRAEFGPRALGNRSIIASPTNATIRSRMNLEIKRRPEFQPFCPSILDEEKDRLFENAYLNKHMTTAFRLKKEYYDNLPSAIHVDGTARVQFVCEDDNPSYYKILKEVKRLTGFGVVLNTSFNKHGRTIVESPEHAVIDFLETDMDYLVIEGYLVMRKQFAY